MSEMKDFVTWFIVQLPGFLLSEPISAFTGIMIMCYVGNLVRRMTRL